MLEFRKNSILKFEKTVRRYHIYRYTLAVIHISSSSSGEEDEEETTQLFLGRGLEEEDYFPEINMDGHGGELDSGSRKVQNEEHLAVEIPETAHQISRGSYPIPIFLIFF